MPVECILLLNYWFISFYRRYWFLHWIEFQVHYHKLYTTSYYFRLWCCHHKSSIWLTRYIYIYILFLQFGNKKNIFRGNFDKLIKLFKVIRIKSFIFFYLEISLTVFWVIFALASFLIQVQVCCRLCCRSNRGYDEISIPVAHRTSDGNVEFLPWRDNFRAHRSLRKMYS